MTEPLISVITVTRNASKTLEKTILSVLHQNYKSVEYIIIDGASADGSINILQKFQSSLTYVSEPDKGIYDAMNKGIGMAKGKWIYFLGSDDILYSPNILAQIKDFLTDEQDFVYGNVIFEKSNRKYDGEFNKEKILTKNICHQAIFYKKTLFETFGLFNLNFKYVADYDFNLKIWANEEIKIKYINLIIAIFNESGFSSTAIDYAFYNQKEDLLLKYGFYSKHTFEYAKNSYFSILQSKEYRFGLFILSPLKKLLLIVNRFFYKK